MPASPPLASVCSTCGRALNGNGDCLACLVRLGFAESEEEKAQSSGYGDFEIARREDGSPWELGHGAMGVTYRATDTVLHRSVALKVIDVPPTAGTQGVRDRFLREARAAAALRHPNVASVFHFGASPEMDRCYYAMELVEGETLEARVRRDGPLPLELALDVAIQVTRALIAAAAQNLIHRDLKPANIMLAPHDAEEGKLEAKVIDFGLAKLTAAAANEKDLTHGGFVGTPAFASPEQFDGEPADARSDIYSLGVTLWYALTGELPCPGRTIEEIRHSQTQLPLPIAQLKARKLPSRVIAVLRRALAVDPAERPASARALLAELQTCRAGLASPNELKPSRSWQKWATLAATVAVLAATFILSRSWREKREPPPAIPNNSIAVLPFGNRSDRTEDAIFAEGMQDEVLATLGRIKNLRVIGRSSVMGYPPTVKHDLHEIGLRLGVAFVLEGNLRREPDRLLLRVSLIDTRDGHQVWAERFDRAPEDAITLQNEIALEIAAVLEAKLAPPEKERFGTKATNNPEAFLLYLRARARETRVDASERDLIAAEDLYRQAISHDPNFALAHARASMVNARLFDGSADVDRRARARMQAEHALQLAPALGEAHLALGMYLFLVEKNRADAPAQLEIAARASPNDAESFRLLGAIHQLAGDWRKAIADYERALQIEPGDASVSVDAGCNYMLLRNWSAAIAAFQHARQIDPNSGFILLWLNSAEYYAGNPSASRVTLEKLPATFPPRAWLLWEQYWMERNLAAASKVVNAFPETETNKTYCQALIARARGDLEMARGLFEKVRPAFELRVRDQPEMGARHAELGMLYAYLDRKEEAIREGRRGVDLAPKDKEPLLRARLEGILALIYTRLGAANEAIPLLERLLITPGAIMMSKEPNASNITLADLRYRWEWDPLRNDPRFQKILAAPEPKTIY